MSKISKFIKVHQYILVEWIYDNDNIITENYKILNNLDLKEKSFISTQNINNIDNTIFPVDPILKKYTKVDTTKYSFLQVQDYFTAPLQYDTIKIYFPLNFDFLNLDYKGFYVNVYANNFYETLQYNLSNYVFDNESPDQNLDIQLGNPFFYNEQQWGKFITFNIPSIDIISKQRIIDNVSNLPIDGSINQKLTNGEGLSQNSPIFLDFSWITSNQTLFGIKYFYISETNSVSFSKVPEFQTLGCQIVENTNYDYFEIFGTYGDSNENLDNFIEELNSKGRKIQIQYDVTLYEENIMQNTVTYIVTEYFSRKIIHRPVITFSNTTAYFNVNMRVIDLVDNSTITRFASLGITNSIFKYGVNLNRINIENAFKPKIYNLKNTNNTNTNNVKNSLTNLNITKVNYPILIERSKILASSSKSVSTVYKGNGLLEILLSPFDNIIKFDIASDINNNGNIQKYNLSNILINAKLKLVFKSNDTVLEKEIFQESPDNDYTQGIIVFKVEEQDLKIIKNIRTDNKNFYIIVKSDFTNISTLLYSGTFELYENVTFIDKTNTNTTNTNTNSGNTNTTNTGTITNPTTGKVVSVNPYTANPYTSNVKNPYNIDLASLLKNNINKSLDKTAKVEPKFNMLVFLTNSYNSIYQFENQLTSIINMQKQIHTKYNLTYFIIGLTQAQVTSIMKISVIDKKATTSFSTNLGS
jgi:hypothetical protein